MKICFVSPEVFSWGLHGGFGYLTRVLSSELTKRGFDVSIVTKRRPGQGEIELMDGVTVYSYPATSPYFYNKLTAHIDSIRIYKKADADIYHSQAISYNSIFAKLAMPNSQHIITFQDPYDLNEWQRISKVDRRYNLTPIFKARCLLESRLLATICNRSDALYAQARFLIPKSVKLFKLSRRPSFLPNPVYVPKRVMKKADVPTVCFLARWDPQKRPHLFMELAERLPEVEFIAMGHSHNPMTDYTLRRRYSYIPNLRLTGFVSERDKSSILEKSWALVNTSIREALPVSFLEALAHETLIISGENPDGLTQTYGYVVQSDDYIKCIESMINDSKRSETGRKARENINRVYSVDKVVNSHIKEYKKILERSGKS